MTLRNLFIPGRNEGTIPGRQQREAFDESSQPQKADGKELSLRTAEKDGLCVQKDSRWEETAAPGRAIEAREERRLLQRDFQHIRGRGL
ncbi:hypothetical protein SKAU_G00203390 [Synaphobranchus kaupii]|uniref:Uncharacterized protein n=1 Tax=Synaphobranchus kaupii TaxID=118154 RepID=A0A9Q1FGA8_SYNKA|nr:hypothetical protein SKAU_G00203390 [Synaphobranchus kaupii]